MQQSIFPDYPTTSPKHPASPALKWAGGKRWLVPHLKPLWQQFTTRRLVEPFMGGMGVTLGLQPGAALLSDINEHLINFYLWLQQGLTINLQMLNEETAFYEARAQFNHLIRTNQHHSAEAASLFYYLNRTCFNGLCRFNSKNEFNVPFGRYKSINYISDFTHFTGVLKNWTIACHSFDATVLGDNDFLYIDPPYDTPFTQYAKENFTWEDQQALAHWLCRTDVPIIVSNQATARITQLYQDLGFSITTLLAPRRIASSGNRTPAVEMLATKNI